MIAMLTSSVVVKCRSAKSFADIPNYRKATDTARSCGTCSFFRAGVCTMFDAKVDSSMVCDEWEAKPKGMLSLGTDRLILKAGFTGERRDSAGRRICYRDGKRVPCPKKEGAEKPELSGGKVAEKVRAGKPSPVIQDAAPAVEKLGIPAKSAAAFADAAKKTNDVAALAKTLGTDKDKVLDAVSAVRPPDYWGSKEQPYWRPGPNKTVDNIITRDGKNGRGREVLMIRRAAKAKLPDGKEINFVSPAGDGMTATRVDMGEAGHIDIFERMEKKKSATTKAFAIGHHTKSRIWNQHLLPLPDIRQDTSWSCGAATTMAVGRYFDVGPDSLDEWKQALGTTEKTSTKPARIVEYLTSLGLEAKPRQHMTIRDLRAACLQGKPVICCVQEYGNEDTSYKYGHYLAVIGVAMGFVFVQDPSMDNALGEAGGSQGDDADTQSLNAPGRSMIPEDVFDRAWHDKDVDGNEYDHFGIVVGKRGEKSLSVRRKCQQGVNAGKPGPCPKPGGETGTATAERPAASPSQALAQARPQAEAAAEKLSDSGLRRLAAQAGTAVVSSAKAAHAEIAKVASDPVQQHMLLSAAISTADYWMTSQFITAALLKVLIPKDAIIAGGLKGGAAYGMAVEHGLATNGRWLMKLPPKEHEKVKAAKGEYDKVYSDRLHKMSAEIMSAPTETHAATIAGGRIKETEVGSGKKKKTTQSPEYLIQSPSGKQAIVNAEYIQAIKDRWPKATMHLDLKKPTTGPIQFKMGKETVGVVMPLDMKEKPEVKGASLFITKMTESRIYKFDAATKGLVWETKCDHGVNAGMPGICPSGISEPTSAPPTANAKPELSGGRVSTAAQPNGEGRQRQEQDDDKKPASDEGSNPKSAKEAKTGSPQVQKTVQAVAAKAKANEGAAVDAVAKETGHSAEDVRKKLLEAWDKAEVTINFPAHDADPNGSRAASLGKSGRLSNLFETGHGRGVTDKDKRDQMEKGVFGNQVGEAEAKDRPKYGAINWGGAGSGAAPEYGKAAIVLNKDYLKQRMTIAPGDTGHMKDSEMATAADPLNGIARNADALQAAGLTKEKGQVKDTHTEYNEVHVHGDLPLNKDTVKEIRLPKEPQTTAGKQGNADMEAFAKKSGIPVTYYEQKASASAPPPKKPGFWGRLLGRKSLKQGRIAKGISRGRTPARRPSTSRTSASGKSASPSGVPGSACRPFPQSS